MSSTMHNHKNSVSFERFGLVKRGRKTPTHECQGVKPKSVGFVHTILQNQDMIVAFSSGEACVLANEVVKLIPLDRDPHVRLREDVEEPRLRKFASVVVHDLQGQTRNYGYHNTHIPMGRSEPFKHRGGSHNGEWRLMLWSNHTFILEMVRLEERCVLHFWQRLMRIYPHM